MGRAVDCASSEPFYKRYSFSSSSSSSTLISSSSLCTWMIALTHTHVHVVCVGVVLLFLCSGLLDSQTLVSDKAAQTTSQFVAVVLKDGKE